MPISRKKWGAIQRSAWLSTPDFVAELSKHQGETIELRWKRGKNLFVSLLAVSSNSVTFERHNEKQTLPVADIDGFTTSEEWWNHRKK